MSDDVKLLGNQVETIDDEEEADIRPPLLRLPASRLGRVGCYGLVVLWFAVLMLPCGFFFFAMGGEIRLLHRQLPDAESHPWLQVSLISSVENRGLQVIRSVLERETLDTLCIETYVDYLVWQTDGSAQSATFCDCYARRDETWVLAVTQTQACQVP